jgi:hypothetical protein
MFYQKRKIQLSPRLRYGIGRTNNGSRLLKLSGILFLFLAAGLTLNAFGLFFSNDTPKQQPQVLGAQDAEPNESQAQFIEYTVKKGDTLFNIGQQYNVDWTTLMILNNLDNTTLKTGQKINIPTK